ncbi:arginine methyl transferase [Pleurotus eryngii]|uniref:Arginine methyl transferase n=1 Tax=Pleurotus eryngii TaxID=5323 RepID=A0A9P6A7D9_PLEER|nr:arginine methyl transferase [Pleurotus eryngii]
MDNSEASPEDVEVLTDLGQLLIDAILQDEPLEKIDSLIDAGAPLWYQTEDEGLSALHAAVHKEDFDLAKILLGKGAIWNAVDNEKITAGEVALSLNDEKLYTLIRDAGIRSEMLLALLSKKHHSEPASSLILRSTDESAAGSTDAFLSSKLRYTTDAGGQEICLLQMDGGEEVGVMMGWEREIMRETVSQLCEDHPNFDQGLKILNVGFGLGIIDTLFQQLSVPPSQHVIIEPHPDVLAHMKSLGWDRKPGVRILAGKWQDFVESEGLLQTGGFDVVYTDTFSEDYGELHKFFEALPDLLSGTESRFSFFNGLGATNALFYDVYTHLSELHLAEIGLDVEWRDLDVTPSSSEARWGQTREYFSLPIYWLPIGMMKIMEQ